MLKKILALILLKAAPQDLPYSQPLAVQTAIAYIFSGIFVLQTTIRPDDMLAGLLFGLFVQMAFTYLVLRALNRAPRFLQTFTAIIGVGALFNLISWPVLLTMSDSTSQESIKATMSLVFLLLISWEVLVKAHIFRHALEMRMISAMMLSFSLLIISVALSQMLFPAAIE